MRSGRGRDRLIPEALAGGRPRKTDMPAPMNAIFVFAAHRLPLALSAPRLLSVSLDVYNIFRKLQRDGV